MKTGLKVALDPTRRSVEATQFETSLRRKVVGQNPAVEQVVEIYQQFLAGLNPPGRPVGNLLFLGPTGTGKTRVVEAMAESLFGDPRACIKIDCAEFQHSHEIAKLVGSPPGYLGHRETHPLLTQEALDQWHTEKVKLTLLLFDEIEKASDALWQLLLGVMDKATLTLGDNRRVDLSHCLIILTSNLGAGDMMALQEGGGLGFQAGTQIVDDKFDERLAETAKNAAKKKFTPEFMNRIDKTVVFKTLRQEHLEEITDIELGMLQQRILQATGTSQFVFTLTAKAKKFLLMEGTDPKYGARHLKRAIEKSLTSPMSSLMASGQIKLGDFLSVDIDDADAWTFTKVAEGALVPVLLEKYGATLSTPAKAAIPPRKFAGLKNLLDGGGPPSPGDSKDPMF